MNKWLLIHPCANYEGKFWLLLKYKYQRVLYLSNELLAKEVAHLDEGAPLSNGAVDGEVSVHSAHLVQVTLDDTYEASLKPHESMNH